MNIIDTVSLKLDVFPWNAVIRFGLGWLLGPVYVLLCQERCPQWGVLVFFVCFLVTLRVGTLLLRKALPFSPETQATWAARRRLAKVYDSYQWQKLFWLGLGLAVNVFVSRYSNEYMVGLAIGCIVAGGMGLCTWLMMSRNLPIRSGVTA